MFNTNIPLTFAFDLTNKIKTKQIKDDKILFILQLSCCGYLIASEMRVTVNNTAEDSIWEKIKNYNFYKSCELSFTAHNQ